MQILLDTINLEKIKEFNDYLPLTGVTCNPSIVKEISPKDFYSHMNEIRDIIGIDKQLHVQLTETSFDGMIKEAEALTQRIDKEIYLKVPTDFVGIKVIKALKEKGYHVTATAIYDYLQSLIALEAGADCIAPYVNRIANIGSDPIALISDLRDAIEDGGFHCEILAASFHALSQIADACRAGAQSVTVDPEYIEQIFSNPSIVKAVDAFRSDWYSMYDKNLIDLK